MHVQPGTAVIKQTLKNKLQILQNKTRFALDLSPPPRIYLDITHFHKIQWLLVYIRVEQLNLNIMHRVVHGSASCYLTKNFEWLVRWVILRRDTERCSCPCHQLDETDVRFLNLMALNHGINYLCKKGN